MKLHWSPRSPYVRKVMIVAHELGLADRIETVRTVVGGTTPHRELMRENPLGKIPTLVLEDGRIIYDLPVICEYLDTLHDGPKLYPAWPERLTALRRLALGDGMLDIALPWLGERFRPVEKQSEPHMALWQRQDPHVRGCARAGGGCAGGEPHHDRPRRDRHCGVVSGFPVCRIALARRPSETGGVACVVRCAAVSGGQPTDRRQMSSAPQP